MRQRKPRDRRLTDQGIIVNERPPYAIAVKVVDCKLTDDVQNAIGGIWPARMESVCLLIVAGRF